MIRVRRLAGDLRAEARPGDAAADDHDVEIRSFLRAGYELESRAV